MFSRSLSHRNRFGPAKAITDAGHGFELAGVRPELFSDGPYCGVDDVAAAVEVVSPDVAEQRRPAKYRFLARDSITDVTFARLVHAARLPWRLPVPEIGPETNHTTNCASVH